MENARKHNSFLNFVVYFFSSLCYSISKEGDIDGRTIESKEGFETKELFKSCRLDDYKEEDNERSEK